MGSLKSDSWADAPHWCQALWFRGKPRKIWWMGSLQALSFQFTCNPRRLPRKLQIMQTWVWGFLLFKSVLSDRKPFGPGSEQSWWFKDLHLELCSLISEAGNCFILSELIFTWVIPMQQVLFKNAWVATWAVSQWIKRERRQIFLKFQLGTKKIYLNCMRRRYSWSN